jgi:GNAT superfamily N-acetyltransferase
LVAALDAIPVGAALAAAWEHLTAALPGAWVRRAPGALGGVTRVAIPGLNGAWAYGEDAHPAAIADLLDRVAAAGVPHCLQVSPRCGDALRELGPARGMRRDTDIPLMALDRGTDLPAVDPGHLAVTVLEPERAAVHAELAAVGFDAPADAFLQLTTPSVLRRPGVCAYIGEIDGKAVATGVGVRLAEHVGIFNVATLPAHRRRGYGAAITARAVRDGLDQGAKWAWLQSTTDGYRVYEQLGFRTLESWECWIAVEQGAANE